ncbi:MAG: UDP-4-amino-4,6-dideoxy-N-acetyl-beta-L-altrosamine transaminase [Candidatus Taylorbacteria bacterium RIFCSPLOWO2_02_FULL_43_11]|uniref:UDP-4-amino-4, 6-dideoxy-N-acetyl-beta-L-altrosamine transaminase n=1 Tax=Candidatus Taylorbacteria bacterium RIFCSPHIGHO2_02_FULL_43_32b TaxID=1802306 RepID=A0A1G2MNN1_9BACT|nr:MAG: UDP-4-amino-4,6-dideoxy-N-acetyl-beta-L-altrosamine transaminase [Candidatus Taylorbacteria bacterium RIFCSPHIGHO2_02_FULL_43_32b]OHA35819.1 MAG: UDP-4-amino-4,6-dideoxy-N-acetyl-beta-L-altrosamine transaminase [Candidatus Taylorbacteria bacterium RIFCSPLOWO2_02_FULL_43_11]
MKKEHRKNIPYGHQSLSGSDIKYVSDVLRSDWLTQGPSIGIFENKLSKVCGVRYATVVSSGTAALHLAYLASGIGKDDEVITTPNTFVATTNMLLAVGAKPIFCDIRLDTYNIEENKIEKLITPRTKAIVPVHFAGNPCNMAVIMAIAKKHRLIVIEDACHALGSAYKNKKIGSIGDMTIFSFHPVKTITTGEGGAVVTNSKAYAATVKLLRSHGVAKKKTGFNVMTEFGYNYRLTDVCASLGISQLDRLGNFLKKRKVITEKYREYLYKNPHIILPTEAPDSSSAWHLYVILVRDWKDRLPLYNFLKRNGIGANFHYPPVYSHPFYRKHGYKNVRLQSADFYASRAITLPIFPDLSVDEVARISNLVNAFFKIMIR